MSGANDSRDRSVQAMFDRIARRYDLVNGIISLRLDRRWRRHVIEAARAEGSRILDIGTGTGDLIYQAARELRGNGLFVGLDFAPAMLRLARAKGKKPGNNPAFVLGSGMAAPFKDGMFDSAVTAFVLRNVSDLPLLFAEAYRVLRPGGKFVCLDMFPPRAKWFAPIYGLYFHCFMPRVAALLAHDRQAYRYLSESVRRFHSPQHVAEMIRQCGFEELTVRRFLNGAVCMHTGRKTGASTV